MRTTSNQYKAGRLINGYDYNNQAWVVNGVYVTCDHPINMSCGCYGRDHQGQKTITDHTTLKMLKVVEYLGG